MRHVMAKRSSPTGAISNSDVNSLYDVNSGESAEANSPMSDWTAKNPKVLNGQIGKECFVATCPLSSILLRKFDCRSSRLGFCCSPNSSNWKLVERVTPKGCKPKTRYAEPKRRAAEFWWSVSGSNR